jgi:DNA-binding NarL/FixJ family response regulator
MDRDRGAGGGSGAAGDSSWSVVVADDNVALRRSIVELVDSDRAFRVVAEAGNADEAVRHVSRHRPDVALLDVDMPGDGVAAASRIAAIVPSTRVVAFSAYDDASNRHAMQDAGAVAYAVKGRDALLDVLRSLRV